MEKNSRDKYEFDVNDFEFIKNIKQGGFGVIKLVRDSKTKEEYAAKNNFLHIKAENKHFIQREIRILIRIQHPTIVKFRGYSNIDFNGDKNFTIFMDCMKKQSLADLINYEEKSLCPITYDNTKRQIILVGIARGMMILHENHIIQRDLKPENILLDINYHPRITDFGLSKKYDPFHSMYQSISNSGTASYMAPEVINSNHFNTKADVYSFGIIMYEIITGKRAFKKLIDEDKKLKKKVSKGFRPEIEEGSMKKSLKMLIEKCWLPNPRERPTASELFKKLSLSNDDYFSEFYDDDDDDEFSENKKYCLDGVDFNELFEYIDEISEDPTSIIDKKKTKEIKNIEEKISTLESDLNDNKKLSEKIQEMTTKITSLESQLNESKVESTKIKDDNKKLSEQIKEMTTKITSLESQLNESKVESTKIKDDNKKLSGKIQEISLNLSICELEIEKLKKIEVHDKSEIEKLNSQVQAYSLIISSIYTPKEKIIPIPQKIESFIISDINQEAPGLLCILKNKSKNPFDHLFIASQSSNDIFNLIIKSDDTFVTQDKGNFFIEFHLKEAVIINGVKIYSSFGSFPQSFDILVDGKIVKSIKETAELSKPYSKMLIQFNSIKGEKVRFIQTGPNRDKGNNNLWFKQFEIMSSESKYLKGVFSTLIEEAENKNPHKCPVIISSSNFDLNHFYLLNNKSLIYTRSLENSWFQIELTQGLAILKGFRLRESGSFLLKKFKIICTNDEDLPVDSWTILIEVDEKIKDKNSKTVAIEFANVSPPVKFIRLVNTGLNGSNKNNLIFHHLDFFGVYF